MARYLLEENVGTTDRYVRITVGSLLLAAGAGRIARRTDLTGVALGMLGGMTLADGILGTCPYYSIVGVDTRADRSAEPMVETHEYFEEMEPQDEL